MTQSLHKQISLRKELPKFRIGYSQNQQMKARVGFMPGSNQVVLITISENFLLEIYNHIQANSKNISAVMQNGVEKEFPEKKFDLDLALQAIYNLSIHFVLHHELFHVLCGHLDQKRGDFQLAEINEPQRYNNPNHTNTELHFYFLELEADNSALIWLIHMILIDSVNNFFIKLGTIENDLYINEMKGITSLMAYEMLFIAVWMVISLIEKDRIDHQENDQNSHPLPNVRLISCIQTMLENHCDLAKYIQEDERHVILEDESIALITEFLEFVIVPVSVFFAGFPNADDFDLGQIKHKEDFYKYDSTIKTVIEWSKSFNNDTTTTEEGKQLCAMETIRDEMVSLFRPHRYLEETVQ